MRRDLVLEDFGLDLRHIYEHAYKSLRSCMKQSFTNMHKQKHVGPIHDAKWS